VTEAAHDVDGVDLARYLADCTRRDR